MLQVCSLRGTIAAVNALEESTTSGEQCWGMEDVFEANEIDPHAGTAVYLYYCAFAACIAGISAVGFAGYAPAITVLEPLGSPVAYVSLWLVLFLVNRVLALFHLTYYPEMDASIIETSVVWLHYVILSLFVTSATTFLMVIVGLIASGWSVIGVIFVIMSLPRLVHTIRHRA